MLSTAPILFATLLGFVNPLSSAVTQPADEDRDFKFLLMGIQAQGDTTEALAAVRLMVHFHCLTTDSVSSDVRIARRAVQGTLDELKAFQRSGSNIFFSQDTIWEDIAMSYVRLAILDETEGLMDSYRRHRDLAMDSIQKSADPFKKSEWNQLRTFVEKVDANYKKKATSLKVVLPSECYPRSNPHSSGRQPR